MEYTTKYIRPPVVAKKDTSCACGYVDILFWSSGEIKQEKEHRWNVYA